MKIGNNSSYLVDTQGLVHYLREDQSLHDLALEIRQAN